MINQLPEMSRIQSLEFKVGEPVEKSICKLKYEDSNGEEYQVSIPIMAALYLLNLLRSLDLKVEFIHIGGLPNASIKLHKNFAHLLGADCDAVALQDHVYRLEDGSPCRQHDGQKCNHKS